MAKVMGGQERATDSELDKDKRNVSQIGHSPLEQIGLETRVSSPHYIFYSKAVFGDRKDSIF
jgi:hypothetical protein